MIWEVELVRRLSKGPFECLDGRLGCGVRLGGRALAQHVLDSGSSSGKKKRKKEIRGQRGDQARDPFGERKRKSLRWSSSAKRVQGLWLGDLGKLSAPRGATRIFEGWH